MKFHSIIKHIHKKIAVQKSSEYICTLLAHYKVLYHADCGDIKLLNLYNVHKFCHYLKNPLPESKLSIVAERTKKIIAWNTGIDLQDPYRYAE